MAIFANFRKLKPQRVGKIASLWIYIFEMSAQVSVTFRKENSMLDIVRMEVEKKRRT